MCNTNLAFDFPTRQSILDTFQEVQDELQGSTSKFEVILIGASSLIVRQLLERSTSDIDIIPETEMPKSSNGFQAFLHNRGFHVVSESLVNLHPDYDERLDDIVEFENITVRALSLVDVIISKIGRGTLKDLEDVSNPLVLEAIRETHSMAELREEYMEALGYWIGIESSFELSWELFEDMVNKVEDSTTPKKSQQI